MPDALLVYAVDFSPHHAENIMPTLDEARRAALDLATRELPLNEVISRGALLRDWIDHASDSERVVLALETSAVRLEDVSRRLEALERQASATILKPEKLDLSKYSSLTMQIATTTAIALYLLAQWIGLSVPLSLPGANDATSPSHAPSSPP